MTYLKFMRSRKSIGKYGEERALEYLENSGYQLLVKNFRKGRGEIDIIVIRDKTLVFVEVKTRTSIYEPNPIDGLVRFNQKQKLRQTADGYLENITWHGSIRFDVIVVYLSTPEQINHYPAYFD